MLPSSRFGRSASVGVWPVLLCAVFPYATGSAAAQSRIEVTPYFASYFPLIHYVEFNQVSTNLGGRVKQTVGPAVGLQLSAGIRPQLSMVADVRVVSSGQIETSDEAAEANAALPTRASSGTLVVATGSLVFRPRRSNLRLGAGVGWMSRGGDAWDEERYPEGIFFDTGNITTTFSIGSRGQLTPTWPLFVALEALVYSVEKVTLPEPTDPDFENGVKKFQVDILLKLGVPIGGR
jgi:hypothetical protein